VVSTVQVATAAALAYADAQDNPMQVLQKALVRLLWEEGLSGDPGPFSMMAPKLSNVMRSRLPELWAQVSTGTGCGACCALLYP
jgi:hypothetical protein